MLAWLFMAGVTSARVAGSGCAVGDTGLLNPAAEAARTGGDGNGFELNPTGAFTDGDGFASNIDGPGDEHRYSQYGISIPAACAIAGIEAHLDWWLDSTDGTDSMSVRLSWDGGRTWTAAKRDSVETTAEHTTILGSPSDTWGRTWMASEFTNFRVRVTSDSNSASRDFFLDWIPVRVFYVPTEAPVTFSDVTVSAGITLKATFTWGMAWGDYDNDGYADLFVNRHGAIPALYRNNGDGTFVEVVRQAGMTLRTDRHGCAWGDYNADMFLDLCCTTGAHLGTGSIPNQLFRNNRDGTFTDVAHELGVDDGPGRGRTVNWLDYNGDQHLDLYVANDPREGFPSRLFRGLSGTFDDVSEEAGVDASVYLEKGGSTWADYDGDDDPDILIAAYSQLILYRNRGDGTFATATSQAGLAPGGARSAAWGDYDSDGDLDLFVAGSHTGAGPEVLYENVGDGTFRDATGRSGIAQSRTMAALWGDYDDDGDLDLFVVNRYDTNPAQNVPDALYLNNGDGTFTDVAVEAGVTGPTTGVGDSAAWADFDNDGFLDLFVTNGDGKEVGPGPFALYRNNGNGNHWLELKLGGSTANTFGYGAKVWIAAGGKSQFRQLTDGVVARGQSDQIVHFGLGSATTVDEISIRWPNGQVQRLFNVAANQILYISQPNP